MSAKIRKLPDNIICRIRSELAITSTVQCMEELVLNAIDSKCVNVAVRLDLDIFKITVVDDGEGMSEDGLNIIGTRYVTSKCKSLKDFEASLKYLGCRGEALASIISTSAIVEINSRSKLHKTTYFKLFLYGKSKPAHSKSEQRPSIGTTVTITDFMYNLPVRRKLIKPTFDIDACRKKLECIALIHPYISFSLTTDKNKCIIMKTKRTNSSIEIFKQIYGLQIKDYLSEVDYFKEPYKIVGIISKQSVPDKSFQILYVNKRHVFNKKITSFINNLLSRSAIILNKSTTLAVSSPYVSPQNVAKQYCLFLIEIKCPFHEYDISFEPRKSIVEFSHTDKLLQAIELTLMHFMQREMLPIQPEVKYHKSCFSTKEDTFLAESNQVNNKTQKNKLAVFASNFKIEPSDVGSVEGLPARRKPAIIDVANTNHNSDLNNISKVSSNTVVCRASQSKCTSSIQLLRDRVNSSSKLPIDTAPSEKLTAVNPSSLDALKKIYSSSRSKQLTSECKLHRENLFMSNNLSRKKWSNKIPSLKNLTSNFDKGQANQTSNYFDRYRKEKKLEWKSKFSFDTTNEDKSFYFNPQLSEVSLLNCPHYKSTYDMEKLSEKSVIRSSIEELCETNFVNIDATQKNCSSYAYNVISTPSEPLHRDREVSEENLNIESDNFSNVDRLPNDNREFFNLDVEPVNSVGNATTGIPTEVNLIENVDFALKKKKNEFQIVAGSNGRQIYINKETGNSTYIQPLRQDDPVWETSPNLDYNTLPPPSNGCLATYLNKEFTLSHGYMPYKGKRKHIPDTFIADKYLKATSSTSLEGTCDSFRQGEFEFNSDIELHSEDLLDKWKENELWRIKKSLGYSNNENLKDIFQNDLCNYNYEHSVTSSSIISYKISQPYKLNKTILKQAKVIGQLDKKFIAITVPYTELATSSQNFPARHNLLVLLDQHAADERIQLEKKLDENYEVTDGKQCLRWSVIDPTFQLTFQQNEVQLLTTYEEIFESFGLYYVQIDVESVEFTAIPSILVPKDNSEKNAKRCQQANQIVEATVKAICSTISTLRGSSSDFIERRPLPQSLAYIFNTFACKVAIKFGDLLNLEECQSLVEALSKCRLPFQCAHGRPSIFPVLEFGHLSNNVRMKKTKINLNKLQKLVK